MIHPAPDGLIGDRDPAFRQQIFDVAEAQREAEIEPDRVLNDFGRKAIAAIADFDHRGWYGYDLMRPRGCACFVVVSSDPRPSWPLSGKNST
jgi:hypothetical protein